MMRPVKPLGIRISFLSELSIRLIIRTKLWSEISLNNWANFFMYPLKITSE